MNKRMGRMIKGAFLVACWGSFLLASSGCSTGPSLVNENMSRFFGSVRPHQGNPASHYLLACYYQERGRHKDALEEFKKALSIDPGHVKAYNGMGVSYDLLGDFPRAVESYEMALKSNPDLDYVWNNLGYSHLLQGKADEAMIAFKKALALNDRNTRFHYNLGLAYAEKGHFDLAMAEFIRGGDEANAHYAMAQLYLRRGLYGDAISHYVQALRLDPSSTVFQTGLEAANALAKIFGSAPGGEDSKGRVIPDQSAIAMGEIERLVAGDESNRGTSAPEESESTAEPRTLAENPGDENVGFAVKGAVAGTDPQNPAVPSHLPDCAADPVIKERTVDDIPILLRVQSEPINQGPEGIPVTGESDRKGPLNCSRGVAIEVSNGNGYNGNARRVGDYLKAKGLNVIRLTNANRFDQADTRVFYRKEYQDAAHEVAGLLPVHKGIVELNQLDRPNIKIKILIGKDVIPHNRLFEGS